jgi:hypothetical protein
MGLSVPGVVAGATDQQTVQMLALINAVGADLLTRQDWTSLQTQAVIQVPAAVVATANTTLGSTTLANIVEPGAMSSIGTDASLWVVSGTGIVNSTRLTNLAAVANPTSATMDTAATATATGAAVVFGKDTYAVPDDFIAFIDDTQWDRGNKWKLVGPMSPQMDQWQRSGIVATGPRRRFRQVGRNGEVFRLWPPPAQNDTPGPLVYEYLSAYWVQTEPTYTPSGLISTPKGSFTADGDICVFDDRLMIEGLKWRFFAAKGFDYTSQLAIWNNQLQVAMSRDGGAGILPLNRRRFPFLISPAQVPDGNWSGTPMP